MNGMANLDVLSLGSPSAAFDVDPVDPLESAGPPGNRRRKLWELPKGFHCSIVGTCLAQDDLVKGLRKLGRRPVAGSEDYELHGFFVGQAATDNPVSRLMQKLLDARAGGEIRRFARVDGPDALAELWVQATRDGRVAPAYWALLSHPGTTPTLQAHAHGQVHMLSHYMAGLNRQCMDRQSLAEKRCLELEEAHERLQRTSREQLETLRTALAEARRDVRHWRAEAEAARQPQRARPSGTDRQLRRLTDRLAGYERKLAVERHRARTSERDLERLRALLDLSAEAVIDRIGRHTTSGPTPVPTTEPASEPASEPLDTMPRAILYVGGRATSVPHLRTVAARHAATLYHHDGGLEESVRLLDSLVERCDVVCCPIDCVSHDACVRVKRLCKRLQKPFVPLRSNSASGLHGLLRAGLAASPTTRMPHPPTPAHLSHACKRD